MGRGGLYFRQTLPSANSRRTPPEPQDEQTSSIAFQEIESGSVSQMVDSSSAALLEEINTKSKKMLIWPWVLGSSIFLLLVFAVASSPIWLHCLLVSVSAGGWFWAVHADKLRKTVVLFYELEPHIEEAFQGVHSAFDFLRSCSRVWHVESKGNITTTYDWKVNAGANAVVRRKAISPHASSPPYFQCNVSIPVLPAGRQRLYFLPDRILVWSTNGVGAVGFEQRFIESDGVPTDTRVVDKTWKYVNKKGGPDRRFNDNREIPIVLYEAILLASRTGVQELFQTSKNGIGSALSLAVKRMASAISQREESKMEDEYQPPSALDNVAQEHSPPVSDAIPPIVFAAQSAVAELFEVVESLSDERSEQEALREDAEKTILRLIAAIVLADGQYRDDEKALVSILVDWTTIPGGESRYLNEYAAKWAETSEEVPNFFTAAVRHDSSNKTEVAREMLRKIQLIGNNVCACDARCGALERGIVQRYVVLLENFIEETRFS